jgi:hypothetical protein
MVASSNTLILQQFSGAGLHQITTLGNLEWVAVPKRDFPLGLLRLIPSAAQLQRSVAIESAFPSGSGACGSLDSFSAVRTNCP